MKSFANYFLNSTLNPNVTAAQKTTLVSLSSLPIDRSLDNGINFSDNTYKQNVGDGTLAQFVVEKADCRVFFTKEMFWNVSAMWEKAAGVASGGEACVVGGIRAGMVLGKRDVNVNVEVGVEEMEGMTSWAEESRALLERVQLKAKMEPVERMSGWEEMHARAIPAMHVFE